MACCHGAAVALGRSEDPWRGDETVGEKVRRSVAPDGYMYNSHSGY